MKKLLAILVLCLSFTGCVNVYTRWPTTDSRIEDTYQSTQVSFAFAYVVAFPQVLPMNGTDGLVWENIITIPCGCVVLCDTLLEGIVDTICWPYDKYVSDVRRRDFDANCVNND